jgi:hypothetical protein
MDLAEARPIDSVVSIYFSIVAYVFRIGSAGGQIDPRLYVCGCTSFLTVAPSRQWL